MRWLPSRLVGFHLAGKPRISCDLGVWCAGVRELASRTLGGQRESGAFLLGVDNNGIKRILEFVFYDDIDPGSLDSGIVHFAGIRLPILWAHCRQRGYGVVADVHVHPHGYRQSASDQGDPVMPRSGHIAIIIPHYAQRGTTPGEIGLYEYRGNGLWMDRTSEGSRFFHQERRA
jgi:hypothetical protein